MEFERTPRSGTEKELLLAFLNQNRAIMTWKTEGMSDEAARTSPFASDTSMIGMLQHLAIVEKSWFQDVFAGRDVDYGFDFDSDRDAEWHLSGTETLAAAIAAYEDAVAASNEIIAGSDLEEMSQRGRREGQELFSLRWIVIHMIEETARHAGHADVLREHLDGTLGYLPRS